MDTRLETRIQPPLRSSKETPMIRIGIIDVGDIAQVSGCDGAEGIAPGNGIFQGGVDRRGAITQDGILVWQDAQSWIQGMGG